MNGAGEGQAPRAEYERRRAAREASFAEADRAHLRLAWPRLATLAVGLALGYGAFVAGSVAAAWLLVPVVALVVLGRRMRRLEAHRARASRARAYYEAGLRRLDGDWESGASTGERFSDPDHLYANDLDLFGPASLFARLSSARTGIGEATLAGWLLTPSPSDRVHDRQQAVAEIAKLLDFREELAVRGEDVGELHRDQLRAWAAHEPSLPGPRFRLLARLLSIIGGAAILAFLSSIVGAMGLVPMSPAVSSLLRAGAVVVGIAVGAVGWRQRRRTVPVLHDAEMAGRELRLVSELLICCENQRFEAPGLQRLRDTLATGPESASARVARLLHRIDWVDARHGDFVRMLGPFVLWDLHLAFALEDWRRVSGADVHRWLTALGEIEAIASVGAYRYENPDLCVPRVVTPDTAGAPIFEAERLGHPLLPDSSRICNDVRLGDAPRLLVVSGSNMSGKSTLLRTVGVNAVLAQAGAPVCAASLRMSPLKIGASIAVQDSLHEGMSRFYTEITRLRAIVGAASDEPLLFLIDELLQGTNSHDRRIGADAIVRGLLDRGAIGLLTTHDLALTEIADLIGDAARNVHFEDELRDGRLFFDYRMRDGVVERSNALELMRSVGLEV